MAFASQSSYGNVHLSDIVLSSNTSTGSVDTTTTIYNRVAEGNVTLNTTTTGNETSTGSVTGAVGHTTLTTGQIPSHIHGITDPGHAHTTQGSFRDTGDDDNNTLLHGDGSHSTSPATTGITQTDLKEVQVLIHTYLVVRWYYYESS